MTGASRNSVKIDPAAGGFDAEVLAELERRHEDVLARLDELDRKIESVLQAVRLEWTGRLESDSSQTGTAGWQLSECGQ